MLNFPGAVAPEVAPFVRKRLGPLVIGAIGIVFGDIGTSPLYTLRACFTGPHGLPLTPDNVLGILSVVFWLRQVSKTAACGGGWSASAFSAPRCSTATA